MMMNIQSVDMWLYMVFGFLFLTAVGSFFNVVIERGLKDSLLGFSKCDFTGRRLNWYEMIPVVSSIAIYIWGRLRKQKNIISIKYFLTECYSGVFGLFLGAFVYHSYRVVANISLIELSFIIFVIILPLLYLALDDIWNHEINIVIVLAQVSLSLLVIVYFPQSYLANLVDNNTQLISAFVMAGFITLVIILSGGKGMGVGDVYLAFFLGLVLGVKLSVVAFLITIFSGSIFGVIMSLVIRKFKGVPMPLVPFLGFGFIFALLFGQQFLLFFSSISYILLW